MEYVYSVIHILLIFAVGTMILPHRAVLHLTKKSARMVHRNMAVSRATGLIHGAQASISREARRDVCDTGECINKLRKTPLAKLYGRNDTTVSVLSTNLANLDTQYLETTMTDKTLPEFNRTKEIFIAALLGISVALLLIFASGSLATIFHLGVN